MALIQKIDEIENSIFDYEINNIMNDIVSVFSQIVENNMIDTNDLSTLNKINMLMGNCINSMQNKDYLLLADQLEYELKPIIGG